MSIFIKVARCAAIGLVASAPLVHLPVLAAEGDAQIVEAVDVSTDAAAKPKPMVDEILVTAQKRAQDIQDVPISMTAIGGETIREHDIQDFNSLSTYLPNASFFEFSYGTFFRMRGLGSGFNDGFEQAVGFYIDDVYYGRGSYYNQGFLDFEQVEVLRGPQGTMFGKNTVAGAISIRTTRPTYEWTGSADVQFGTFEEQHFTGRLTVPVIENKYAIRLAFTDKKRDGYIENYTTGWPAGQQDKRLARISNLIDLTDDLSVRVGLDYHRVIDSGAGLEIENGQPDAMAVAQAFNPREDGVANYTTTANKEERVERESYGGTLHVDWDIWNHSTALIVGYSQYHEIQLLDPDATAAPLLEWDNDDDYDQLSVELRVVSDNDGPISYVGGLYYFHSFYDAQTYLDLFELSGQEGTIAEMALPSAAQEALGNIVATALGIPLNEAVAVAVRDRLDQKFEQDTTTYAAYGQFTWQALPKLAVDLGLRLSYEEKDVTLNQQYMDTGLLLLAGLNAEAFLLEEVKTESNVTPKISVRYDWTDDIMTYATIGDGFKAGGFNPFASNKDQAKFDEETSRTYEAGIKSKLWGHRITANFTVFYTKFKGLQLSTPGQNGSGFLVSNAGEATSKGIELETQIALLENLFITGALGWADAVFDKYPGAPCRHDQEGPCDQSGRNIAESPAWTGSITANYVLPVGNLGFDWVLGADVVYQGETYLDLDYDPVSYEPSYIKLNARTGFRDADGAWAFYIQGKNLTEEETRLQNNDLPLFAGSYQTIMAPKRIVSGQFQLNF